MHRDICIPGKILGILEQDQGLDSSVKSALSDFGTILTANRMDLFPAYTEHGSTHIEGVLAAASMLITDEAWRLMQPVDCAVLVASVLFHDLAMHLSREQVVLLTSCSRLPTDAYQHFGDVAWSIIWTQYAEEARRFSGRENVRLFGSPDPVTVPEMSMGADWTDQQKLLVGEFVRRHHGRLAHEFAVLGFPVMPGKPELRLSGEFGRLSDIVGLIARSHSAPLRLAVDYLRHRYANVRTPLNVNATYLMGLLRIADYLQVERGRAPEQLLRIRSLRSPLSVREWQIHDAVQQVHQDGDDPEAVFIFAEPKDIGTFTRLRDLCRGLQRELDETWAVFGEVYGLHRSLGQLGLQIRRVRSNLDNDHIATAKWSFVPRPMAVSVADTRVLKLLVSPLYGEQPQIAVRELLQNAIDAVRERSAYAAKHPEHIVASSNPPHREADVRVEVFRDTEGQDWVRVSDTGIGMTPEVVENFFLRAGASFRQSIEWSSDFATTTGRSEIARSGRFGIGVLAAFILGERIEVTTRHVTESHGIFFTASLDDELVQLTVKESVPIGTCIAARTSKEVAAKLRAETGAGWDWYRLKWPVVERSIDNEPAKEHFRYHDCQADLPFPWHRLDVPDYADIQWTYGRAQTLLCNGLVIGETADRGYNRQLSWEGETGSWLDMSFPLGVPKVAVFDKDGMLPLALRRDALQEHRYPFFRALQGAVARDFCAFSFVYAPIRPRWEDDESDAYWPYPGYDDHQFRMTHVRPVCHWFFTPDGSAPLTWWHLKGAEVRRFILLISLGEQRSFPGIELKPGEAAVCTLVNRSLMDLGLTQAIRVSLDLLDEQSRWDVFSLIKRKGSCLLGHPRVLEQGMSESPGVAKIRQVVEGRPDSKDLVMWCTGVPPQDPFSCLSDEALAAASQGQFLFADIELGEHVTWSSSPVFEEWQASFGRSVLPYAREARHTVEASGNGELQAEIRRWQSAPPMGSPEWSAMFGLMPYQMEAGFR